MKPTLSVCMIVKNEEKVLGRCLESIVDIADEIIVVDTGSSDRTKQIASKYTNKLYDFMWVDDFSKARNFAASKAKGNWLLALDADEYVDRESFKKLKAKLEKNSLEYNIVGLQIVSFVGDKGINTALNYHERLYKNDPNIYYVRSIHEVLKHNESKEKAGIIDFQIFHTGYLSDTMISKDKSSRNLTLLLDKKDKDPMDYFFIANEYRNLNKLDMAIKYYQKAYSLKPSIDHDWVKKTLLFLAETLHRRNRGKEALEILKSCVEIYPNIVDYKYLGGAIYFDLKQYESSKDIFEEILMQKENLIADSSIDYLEMSPLKYLGEIYEKEGEIQKAVKSYSRALSLNQTDDQMWIKLISLLSNHATLKELSDFLNNNMLNKNTMTPIKVIRILLAVPNQNVQKLSRSLMDEALTPTQYDGLLLKNLLLDNCVDDVVEYFLNKNGYQAIEILATGIFNIIDFILVTLNRNIEEFKKFLNEVKYDQPLNNLYKLLFEKNPNKLNETEESLFIKVIEQAKVLDDKNTIEKLYEKRVFLTKESRERVMEVLQ